MIFYSQQLEPFHHVEPPVLVVEVARLARSDQAEPDQTHGRTWQAVLLLSIVGDGNASVVEGGQADDPFDGVRGAAVTTAPARAVVSLGGESSNR